MIDTTFDFRTDTPKGKDPDFYSSTLRQYHQLLWSRKLPNDEVMELENRKAPYYLTWKDWEFASDAFLTLLCNGRNRKMMEQVRGEAVDFDAWCEEFQHRTYTIGGMIIFPRHTGSMNQRRGMHPRIVDRWDLTMECIRRELEFLEKRKGRIEEFCRERFI